MQAVVVAWLRMRGIRAGAGRQQGCGWRAGAAAHEGGCLERPASEERGVWSEGLP